MKIFLQYHHSLDKKEYKIDTTYFLVNNDHKRYLRRFYDYYLPSDDIKIICNEVRCDVEKLIKTLISNMTELSMYLKNVPNEDITLKGSKIIVTLQKILDNEDLMDNLQQSAKELHPLVHCNITEYIELLKMYDEISFYNRKYKERMEED